MVNIMLMVKAELENLTNLQPQGGVDDPTYTYYLKLKCENCGEESPKNTCLSLEETVPLLNSNSSSKGSKGATTHLVQKCKFCGREGNITMIPGRGSPLTLAASQAGEAASLMLFDCRGCVPVSFAFGNGWKAVSLRGTVFNDIDLSEDEFSEYDVKGNCPVLITDLSAEFRVVK